MNIDIIFSIVILIFSVVVHEVSHGYAAYLLGDNTARYQGRLTLNPFKHLEWFGSFIFPLLSYQLGGFVLGWAKPVPFNPYNLRNRRWGEALVAIAGPLSNLALVLLFGLFLRSGLSFGAGFSYIASNIVLINLVLAVFNLIPIPPLDGSKILFSVLPYSLQGVRNFLETYGTIVVLFFVFYVWQYIVPWVFLGYRLIVGV